MIYKIKRNEMHCFTHVKKNFILTLRQKDIRTSFIFVRIDSSPNICRYSYLLELILKELILKELILEALRLKKMICIWE